MGRKMKISISIGDIFGKLTIIDQLEKLPYEDIKYVCKCACGTIKNITKYSLTSGRTTSCGCRHKEIIAEFKTTHDLSRARIYRIWNGMIQRCDNPNVRNYSRYGGRGITYSKDFSTFEGFYAAMKEGYREDLTIERIDTNGNYELGNVRWATQKEQQRNRTNNRWMHDPYTNEKMLLTDLADKYNLTASTILNRIKYGMSGKDLVKSTRTVSKRLNPKEVIKIKKLLATHRVSAISRMLGISHSIISNIKNGKMYTDIE